MIAQEIQLEDRDRWNAFAVQGSSFGLLQSWEWGEFKEKMGWKVFRVAVFEGEKITAGAQMLVKSLPGGLCSIAYIPRGPVCPWTDAQTTSCLLAELHRIAKLYRAVCLTIEPPLPSELELEQRIQEFGFKPSRYANQPHATIVVDISQGEDELLSQMRKKTRQYIHGAVREGIAVRIGNKSDLAAYTDLMRITSRREHFAGRDKYYYEQEWEVFSKENHCALFMAYHQDQLLAVRTAYCFGSHAAEFHAGSIEHTSDLHPNYLLVWNAMLWAKSQGCTTYDLWGIPDEIGGLRDDGNELPKNDRTDGLWGVYRFKRGFSKNIVIYAGAYDFIYQPRVYPLIANPYVRGGRLEQIMSWMDYLRSN